MRGVLAEAALPTPAYIARLRQLQATVLVVPDIGILAGNGMRAETPIAEAETRAPVLFAHAAVAGTAAVAETQQTCLGLGRLPWHVLRQSLARSLGMTHVVPGALILVVTVVSVAHLHAHVK